MSEKESLRSAADEARKVARAAREFGRFLDGYANYLTQPTRRDQAAELHLSALNKLEDIKAGLMVCSEWVELSSEPAVAQASATLIDGPVAETPQMLAPFKPRTIQIRKKASTK